MVLGRSLSDPLQTAPLPSFTELQVIFLKDPFRDTLSREPLQEEDRNKARELMKESLVELCVIQEWDRLRKMTRNLLFYGPPGTGKSHIAQAYAKYITASGTGSRTGVARSGLPSRAEKEEEGSIFFVQFHPAYTYEDFAKGYKPSKGGHGQYEVRDGPFLMAKAEAEGNPTQQVVLIIDEINRCQLSKVFGDYVDSLPYRGDPLLYSDRGEYGDADLQLPQNLWILGTMNVSDRSLVRVETELRKGFAFVEVNPGLKGSAFQDVVKRKFRKDSLVEPEEETRLGLVELGETANAMLRMANEKLSEAGYDAYVGPSHVFGATGPPSKRELDLQVCSLSLSPPRPYLPSGRQSATTEGRPSSGTPARGVRSRYPR